MEKRYKNLLLIIVFSNIFIYLTFSLAAASFVLTDWSSELRGVCCFVMIFLTLLVTGNYLMATDGK